jgi:ribosome-associated protein
MRDVLIRAEPVELYKLLKFEGMASSGGEAKMVISEGLVTVNGETETRKRKKIMSGDIVAFAGDEIRVHTAASTEGNDPA